MNLDKESELRQFNAKMNAEFKPSCELPQVEETDAIAKPEVKTADSIDPARLEAMKQRAKQLKTKHPHMKTNRIMRKVAEEFKIKLV
jgi:hypothetical protein